MFGFDGEGVESKEEEGGGEEGTEDQKGEKGEEGKESPTKHMGNPPESTRNANNQQSSSSVVPSCVVLWNDTPLCIGPESTFWEAYGMSKAVFFIILDPIGNGLVRSRIYFDSSTCYHESGMSGESSVKHYPGPLTHYMVVSDEYIGDMVRMTVLNVCKDLQEFSRHFPTRGAPVPMRPTSERQTIISSVVQQHAMLQSPAQFYASMCSGDISAM